MQEYIGKPNRIRAAKYTGEPMTGVETGCGCGEKEACGLCGRAFVVTFQRERIPVSIGEWIIEEPHGQGFYPCADEVFRSKYQLASIPVIPMIPCDSKAVSSFGYDKNLKILAVEFSKGVVYHYPNYSFADFEKLRRAESVGKFVIANVQKLAHVKIS